MSDHSAHHAHPGHQTPEHPFPPAPSSAAAAPASSSFVLAATAAAGADSTTFLGEGLPQGTLRALVLRGLHGDGVPGGWPWRPDAPEVVVPRGLSISTVP